MMEQLPQQDPLSEVGLHGESLRYWHDWLSEDNRPVEGSRYGKDVASCAYYTLAAEAIYEFYREPEYEVAESTLELYHNAALNDDPRILHLILSCWVAVPEVLKPYLDFRDGYLNMSQQASLMRLCRSYRVDFNSEHYTPQFDLPPNYVAGWVGGFAIQETKPTIYVGCSPEGEVSS